MKLTITIDLDNAAFKDSPFDELAIILDQVTNRMALRGFPLGVDGMGLVDPNGNTVGMVKVED